MLEVLAGNMGVVVVCYGDTLGEAAVGVLSKSQATVAEPEEYSCQQPVSNEARGLGPGRIKARGLGPRLDTKSVHINRGVRASGMRAREHYGQGIRA